MLEVLSDPGAVRPRIRAALFDFDGTLSTLRRGWEGVMEPFMVESIAGGETPDASLASEVAAYVDRSAGVQTIHQMQWLADAVKARGRNPGATDDPWAYKAEYNRRLMEDVERRIGAIASGRSVRTEFLMRGSEAFLQALVARGIGIRVASGTDEPDVRREAGVLGLDGYFQEIAGAPPGRVDCSKEAVLRRLFAEGGLEGPQVVVFGDGKVEISLARAMGAIAVGVASDEERRSGMNPVKRKRLADAGAHAVVDCFDPLEGLLSWLGL